MINTITHIVGNFLLIPERKGAMIQKLRKELAEVRRKYELLVNAIDDTIWDWDITNNTID